MEHILTYILSKIYWILIYCFTTAGQISLSDAMFCDTRYSACEKFDNVGTVQVDTDNYDFSLGRIFLHNSRYSIAVFSGHFLCERIMLMVAAQRRQLSCMSFCPFECPERHRIRLRFCSD